MNGVVHASGVLPMRIAYAQDRHIGYQHISTLGWDSQASGQMPMEARIIGCSDACSSLRISRPRRDRHTAADDPQETVRPEGAEHQWREDPPRELSVDLVADERGGWVTGRLEAS